MWFNKKKDPYEIVKELKMWTDTFVKKEIKVSVKTNNKNFVILLKDKITHNEGLVADLGRGAPADGLYYLYHSRCTVPYATDYVHELHFAESILGWLLSIPGTKGPLVLPDNDEDENMKHSIRRQDVESVRVVWIKKTEILLRRAEIISKGKTK